MPSAKRSMSPEKRVKFARSSKPTRRDSSRTRAEHKIRGRPNTFGRTISLDEIRRGGCVVEEVRTGPQEARGPAWPLLREEAGSCQQDRYESVLASESMRCKEGTAFSGI